MSVRRSNRSSICWGGGGGMPYKGLCAQRVSYFLQKLYFFSKLGDLFLQWCKTINPELVTLAGGCLPYAWTIVLYWVVDRQLASGLVCTCSLQNGFYVSPAPASKLLLFAVLRVPQHVKHAAGCSNCCGLLTDGAKVCWHWASSSTTHRRWAFQLEEEFFRQVRFLLSGTVLSCLSCFATFTMFYKCQQSMAMLSTFPPIRIWSAQCVSLIASHANLWSVQIGTTFQRPSWLFCCASQASVVHHNLSKATICHVLQHPSSLSYVENTTGLRH